MTAPRNTLALYGVGNDQALHREAMVAAARHEGCTCPMPLIDLPNRKARRKAKQNGRPPRATARHGTACPLHPDHPDNPGPAGPLTVRRRPVNGN